MRSFLIVIWFVCAVARATTSTAQVFIRAGDTTAVGVPRVAGDGDCFVITAAHAVKPGTPISIINSRLQQTAAIVLQSFANNGGDVAILGPKDKSACADSPDWLKVRNPKQGTRLAVQGLAADSSRLAEAAFAVRIAASDMTLSLPDANNQVREGWSGSGVFEDGVLVGLVVGLDSEGRVVAISGPYLVALLKPFFDQTDAVSPAMPNRPRFAPRFEVAEWNALGTVHTSYAEPFATPADYGQRHSVANFGLILRVDQAEHDGLFLPDGSWVNPQYSFVKDSDSMHEPTVGYRTVFTGRRTLALFLGYIQDCYCEDHAVSTDGSDLPHTVRVREYTGLVAGGEYEESDLKGYRVALRVTVGPYLQRRSLFTYTDASLNETSVTDPQEGADLFAVQFSGSGPLFRALRQSQYMKLSVFHSQSAATGHGHERIIVFEIHQGIELRWPGR
jgi:hypothetical protein